MKILLKIENYKKGIIIERLNRFVVRAKIKNKNADTKIYELLKRAKEKGVKIKAFQIYFDEKRKNVILKNDNLQICFIEQF